jgi:hypothetical protein
VEQGRAQRGPQRRGMAAGSAKLRVFRYAVAIPEWRACGQVEQHAQVRRVFHPRTSRVEQLEGPKGRCCDRGLEAEARAGRRNHRPCQLSTRAHAVGARPGSTSCVWSFSQWCSGLASGSLAKWAAKSPCASSAPKRSVTASSSSPMSCSAETLSNRAVASTGERLLQGSARRTSMMPQASASCGDRGQCHAIGSP